MTHDDSTAWSGSPANPVARHRAFTPRSARPDGAGAVGCRCHLCGRPVTLGALLGLGDTCDACYPLQAPGASADAGPLRSGATWYRLHSGQPDARRRPRSD
jgi:hypothetical protein